MLKGIVMKSEDLPVIFLSNGQFVSGIRNTESIPKEKQSLTNWFLYFLNSTRCTGGNGEIVFKFCFHCEDTGSWGVFCRKIEDTDVWEWSWSWAKLTVVFAGQRTAFLLAISRFTLSELRTFMDACCCTWKMIRGSMHFLREKSAQFIQWLCCSCRAVTSEYWRILTPKKIPT